MKKPGRGSNYLMRLLILNRPCRNGILAILYDAWDQLKEMEDGCNGSPKSITLLFRVIWDLNSPAGLGTLLIAILLRVDCGPWKKARRYKEDSPQVIPSASSGISLCWQAT